MKEIYRILSGALGQEQRMAQIANNLANVSTVGFKKDGAAFTDYLREQMAAQAKADGTEAPADTPALASWPVLNNQYIDMAQGPLRQTNQALDLAIDGEGFFKIKAEGHEGPLYSRAGNFMMSRTGELQTPDGSAVLDDRNSPIRLDPNAGGKITVGGNGEIKQGAAVVGKLGLVTFKEPGKLEKYGNNLLQAPEEAGAQNADASVTVRQGMLESSNVNAVDEMVRMIQIERAYQNSQKALQTIDEEVSNRISSMNS